MTDQPDITAFIAANLDREYRDAQLISSGGYRPQRWEVAARGGEWPFANYMSEIIAHDQINTETWDQPHEQNRMALVDDGRNQDEHIARYDPERICLEIEAKRRLLALHIPKGVVYCPDEDCAAHPRTQERVCIVSAAAYPADAVWPCLEVRLLAAPYAGQPGFKPEWRIGG